MPSQQFDDITLSAAYFSLQALPSTYSAVWISSILHFEPAAAAFRIENPFVRPL